MTTTSNGLRVVLAATLALVPGVLHAQTVAITGGKVYPVSGAPIENGTVLVRDGKIVAVGANVTIPSGATRVDATGKWVTPGFISAATQLGVVEIGAVPETRDASATGENNVAASFNVIDGLNPASVLFAPARDDGVTTVGVFPAGGLVAGKGAIIDLVDGRAVDMIRKAPAAMVAQIGSARGSGVSARGEELGKLRELLTDARYFSTHRSQFDAGDSRDLAATRADMEALQPVLAGRLPMIIAANRASDIENALRLAKDFGLKIMIAGGAEAWQVAEALAAAKVPVFAGAMNNIPGSFAELGTRQENVGLLRQAGVQVAVIGNGGGDEEGFNVRNIRFEAGNGVAYGASWDDMLRAVTLAPAEIFGIADRVGSLQAGRDANIVIWSGDPFEFTTRAERVWVQGKEYTNPSRQELLTERYKTLPPAYRAPTP